MSGLLGGVKLVGGRNNSGEGAAAAHSSNGVITFRETVRGRHARQKNCGGDGWAAGGLELFEGGNNMKTGGRERGDDLDSYRCCSLSRRICSWVCDAACAAASAATTTATTANDDAAANLRAHLIQPRRRNTWAIANAAASEAAATSAAASTTALLPQPPPKNGTSTACSVDDSDVPGPHGL